MTTPTTAAATAAHRTPDIEQTLALELVRVTEAAALAGVAPTPEAIAGFAGTVLGLLGNLLTGVESLPA